MSWVKTTHRYPLPSDKLIRTMGVDSVWACDEGTDQPGGCGRRWRIVERVDGKVRWEPVTTVHQDSMPDFAMPTMALRTS